MSKLDTVSNILAQASAGLALASLAAGPESGGLSLLGLPVAAILSGANAGIQAYQGHTDQATLSALATALGAGPEEDLTDTALKAKKIIKTYNTGKTIIKGAGPKNVTLPTDVPAPGPAPSPPPVSHQGAGSTSKPVPQPTPPPPSPSASKLAADSSQPVVSAGGDAVTGSQVTGTLG